jgi:hypothetical protein
MVRGEFERELEDYIAQRRKAKIKFPKLFGSTKKKKMPELPPEIQKYDETTPAESPEVMPGEEPEYPEKKGLFTKVLESLGLVSAEEKKQQPADVPAEEVQHMLVQDEKHQDMKEVAKIALAVIKQLPPDELATFKSSPEFSRLKELLKKHQLIK